MTPDADGPVPTVKSISPETPDPYTASDGDVPVTVVDPAAIVAAPVPANAPACTLDDAETVVALTVAMLPTGE